MKIRTENIGVDIGSKKIIEDISVEIDKGELVGIIGPNGSGKSTLLKTIYRVLKPSNGSVYFDNQIIETMTLKESAKKLGVMTQMNSFSFDFTVFEVVMMGRTPHKKLLERDSNEDFNIAIEAINQVGLEKFINRKFNSLSGGEKQRVMIARAITSQPKALILDEPTNHLDIHYQITLLEIVKNLGISIFSAMHDLNLAAAFCHKIYVMKEGKVVACGKPDEILTPSLIRDVFEVNAVINRVDETGAVNIVYISV